MESESILSKKTLIIIGVVTAVTIIIVAIIATTTVTREDCIIDINDVFPGYYPLVLQSNLLDFFLPNNGSKIKLSPGDSLRLACTGKNNYFILDKSSLMKVTCVSNVTFLVNNVNFHSFNVFNCANYSESSVQITQNKCAGKHLETTIGFNTTEGFVPLFSTCFDNNKKDAIYSLHKLSWKVYNYTQKTVRPNFIQDKFYDSLELDKLYTLTSERAVFQKILQKSVVSVIKNNDYFNKGHLVPNADFIYTNQKRATFYYINVAPQWKSYNAGNWNKLEHSCREFVSNKKLDVIVYTGIYGNVKWKDINSQDQELYLHFGKTKLITVPLIYWKMVYEPLSKNATVFITSNYPKQLPVDLLTCRDICDTIKWLSWTANDVKKGLSVCCKYETAKNIISTLPDLKVNELLT